MSFTLLGILNAQAAGGGGAGAYDLLESTVLATSASSVSFTGLDTYSDYQHLQIRVVGRGERASASDAGNITFNSDTGTNYAYHILGGNGSTVTSSAATGVDKAQQIVLPAASQVAGLFGSTVIDILDFANTTKHKTLRMLDGVTSPTFIQLKSGLWLNTNAITDITITGQNANISTGSRFSLYGIRG